MRKFLQTVLSLLLIFTLTACTDKNVPQRPLGLLDRKDIIDKLVWINNNQTLDSDFQNHLSNNSAGKPSFSIVLDDSGSMGSFLHESCYNQDGNNVYENMIKTLDNVFPSAKCYKLSEGDVTNIIESRYFFTNARNPNLYKRGTGNNTSPLSKYMSDFFDLNTVDQNNHMYIFVSDLCLSGETDENGFPTQFINTLKNFIVRKESTIGIIGVQADCFGFVSDMPDLIIDNNGDILGVSDKKNSVHRNYVNFGNQTERPVYMLFMGNSDMVRFYITQMRERFPNCEELRRSGKYKEYIFDDYPLNDNITAAPDFTLTVPKLNPQMQKWALNVEKLEYLITESLVGDIENNEIVWDNFISDYASNGITLWRVYSEWKDSQISGRPGLIIDLPEKYFIGTSSPKMKVDVNVLRPPVKSLNEDDTDSDNIKAFETLDSWITDASDTSKYIYQVNNSDSKSELYFEFVPKNIKVDEPLLVLVSVEFEYRNDDKPYVFNGRKDFEWIDEWSLDLKTFKDEAYTRNKDGTFTFASKSSPTEAENSYTQANRTPFLNNVFNELLNVRTEFITNALREESGQIVGKAYEYSLFGIVVRDKYPMYYSEAKSNENGGFAFSIDEINQLKKPSESPTPPPDTDMTQENDGEN